jgi:hypothetical protein
MEMTKMRAARRLRKRKRKRKRMRLKLVIEDWLL